MWWDDDARRLLWLPARDRLVGRLTVIGTVRCDVRDLALDLIEQGRYLTGIISVNRPGNGTPDRRPIGALSHFW